MLITMMKYMRQTWNDSKNLNKVLSLHYVGLYVRSEIVRMMMNTWVKYCIS